MNTPDTLKRKLRCAVYTRKSSDEGLDQEYNSIDAQRDAGHAYIASQRAEGWIAVLNDYDDPAFSGGNMERPALKRLMQDITDGLIDIVVVYKIDRLTRSLTDFSRMVEVFEQHKVSFVSVTQQFNTTTSMGRLMLNILLSFAQFEREVTGERIRDKIEASKRKGIWMGGVPPLGYDVVNRRLVPNPTEVALVQRIFTRYVQLRSITLVLHELRADGVTSKSWITQTGKLMPGYPPDKNMIHRVLNNRTYLGLLSHKKQWYPGEHPAIITQAQWDAAHEVLASKPGVRVRQKQPKTPFLLRGLIVSADGRAFSPWHSTKRNGKRYRYYVSQKDLREGAGTSGLPRLPALQIEDAVVQHLHEHMRSHTLVEQMLPLVQKYDPTMDEAQLTVAMTRLDTIWEQLFPAEQERIAHLMIEKVVVHDSGLEVRLQASGLYKLAMELESGAPVCK